MRWLLLFVAIAACGKSKRPASTRDDAMPPGVVAVGLPTADAPVPDAPSGPCATLDACIAKCEMADAFSCGRISSFVSGMRYGTWKEQADQLAMACLKDVTVACGMAARLVDTDERAVELARRGCDAGDGVACWALIFRDGRTYDKPELVDRAMPLLEKQCLEQRHAEACDNAFEVFSYKREDPKRAHAVRTFACEELEDRVACYSMAAMVRDKDAARAVHFLEIACRISQDRNCFELADMLVAGRGVAKDVPRALRYYLQGCERFAGYCEEAAKLLEAGRDVPADPARAKELRERAVEIRKQDEATKRELEQRFQRAGGK